MKPANHGMDGEIIRCFRFMRLFGVTFFGILRVTGEELHAIVGWHEGSKNDIPADEDIQEICWRAAKTPNIDDALAAGEYAFARGWISGDHLQANKAEVQTGLGWSSDRVSQALDSLFRLRAPMIDDGQQTDAFLLHRVSPRVSPHF